MVHHRSLSGYENGKLLFVRYNATRHVTRRKKTKRSILDSVTGDLVNIRITVGVDSIRITVNLQVKALGAAEGASENGDWVSFS